jgi:hypothetical protein
MAGRPTNQRRVHDALRCGWRSRPKCTFCDLDIRRSAALRLNPRQRWCAASFACTPATEGGTPHSARQIAVLLNDEGIAPPGARWQNRTVHQATTVELHGAGTGASERGF